MRSICLYFQVHQPMRLRSYRFFDIGAYHNYYDDYQNKFIMKRVAEKSYLPMNSLLLDLIKEYGSAFKVSFSISGVALEQFSMYAPEVLESFKKLAATGSVEFLAETHSHSLSSLKNKIEFGKQVEKQRKLIQEHFGQEAKTFRNTELIYSDEIGEMVAEMGFDTMLTEGAKHVLGWKSPNFMYVNAINPKLKILLRNFKLSDDIAFRFSDRGWENWPLNVENYVEWLNAIPKEEEVVNLFMDYETFGEHQWEETGIFEFMKALPAEVFSKSDYTFNTPAELSQKLQPVSAIHVPYPISWADEERDLTAWIGNELQDDAFDKLYEMAPLADSCNDPDILKDWNYLQASDHFYYMCTKWFSDGDVHRYFNPYGTPYDAYINYMNVLADFIERVKESCHNTAFDTLKEKGEDVVKEVKKAAKKVSEATKQTVEDSNIEEIIKMSNTKVKEFVKNVDMKELGAVLNEASEEVREKIIPNLTKKAKNQLENIEKEIEKVKKTDLKKYTSKIEKELKNILNKK